MPILEVCLDVHARLIESNLVPLHQHMAANFTSMRSNVEEKYGVRSLEDVKLADYDVSRAGQPVGTSAQTSFTGGATAMRRSNINE